MAQTSIGFNGSISAVQWAQGAALLLSNGFGTGSATDCIVSQVAGSRAVSVAAGRIGGDGVVTTLSSSETVALPAPTNGQWFLLVLNRKWSDGSTSLLVRNGPTTAAASGGGVPASYPASMTRNPGVNADVAVAWLWANSSSTNVLVVPILRAPSAIVPRRGTAAQRDALFGTFTDVGAQAYLQATAGGWYNTDRSATEHYTGTYDATLNPQGAVTAGWYQSNPLSRAMTWGTTGGGSGSYKYAGDYPLLTRMGQVGGPTDSAGRISWSFDQPFPNFVSGVVLMPHQASNALASSMPVLVEGSVSRTGFQTIWGGRASTTVFMPFIAFGG